MSKFVRTSKVRHIFCEAAKDEQSFLDLRLSTATGDHNYIKANTKFLAVAYNTGGGSSLAVINLEHIGKAPTDVPSFTGHTDKVLDFDFNPFNEHIIASGAEDTTVKVWGIPEGGLTSNISEPLVDLTGHMRKVSHVCFHPTANNILTSASSDMTVKLWDIEKAANVQTLGPFSNLVQDICWNHDGSLMAVSCKDKALRIYDPRSGTSPIQVLIIEN
jgi:coronin-1B/1C/6